MDTLADYFEIIVSKYLSAVDAEPDRSNQHEFGGLVRAGLGDFLGHSGADTQVLEGRFLYYRDDWEEPLQESGTLTWYDARRNSADRGPEYRLYYPTNGVTAQIQETDLMVVALRPDKVVYLIFSPAEHAVAQAISWLFGLKTTNSFSRATRWPEDQELSLLRRSLLLLLGLEPAPEVPESDDFEDLVTLAFGNTFPTTADFSAFARETLPDPEVLQHPDETLLRWMLREQELFRALERVIVSERIASGFESVEDFLSFSLSVQNRRKSRAGHALENHLCEIFSIHAIEFERGAKTENNSRPDFLFPGGAHYSSMESFDDSVTMLGAKTSCKDRWRQVLSEAEKISVKYLLTLEAPISDNQLEEMAANRLVLVVPEPLHPIFSDAGRPKLMTLSGFIGLVLEKQLLRDGL